MNYKLNQSQLIEKLLPMLYRGELSRGDVCEIAKCTNSYIRQVISKLKNKALKVDDTIATNKEQENNLKIIEILRPKPIKYQSLLLSTSTVNNTTIGDLKEMTDEEKELYL